VPVTVNTLLMEDSDLSEAAHVKLRHLLVASWDSLPAKKQNELIETDGTKLVGQNFCRSYEASSTRRLIRDTTWKPFNVGPALRHFYELDPSEGRDLILREILNSKGDIGVSVLGMLTG